MVVQNEVRAAGAAAAEHLEKRDCPGHGLAARRVFAVHAVTARTDRAKNELRVAPRELDAAAAVPAAVLSATRASRRVSRVFVRQAWAVEPHSGAQLLVEGRTSGCSVPRVKCRTALGSGNVCVGVGAVVVLEGSDRRASAHTSRLLTR